MLSLHICIRTKCQLTETMLGRVSHRTSFHFAEMLQSSYDIKVLGHFCGQRSAGKLLHSLHTAVFKVQPFHVHNILLTVQGDAQWTDLSATLTISFTTTPEISVAISGFKSPYNKGAQEAGRQSCKPHYSLSSIITAYYIYNASCIYICKIYTLHHTYVQSFHRGDHVRFTLIRFR